MMSFALMGCMIFSASDASAQGRSRSQGGSTTSRSQSAAVSRPNNSTPTVSRSTTPQVSRSSSSSSATPQVNRSSAGSSSNASNRTVAPKVDRSKSTTTTPQVNRSSSSSNRAVASPSGNNQVTRPTTPSSNSSNGTRPGNGAVNRNGNQSSGSGNGSSGVTRRVDDGKVNVTTPRTNVDVTGRDLKGTTTTVTPKGNDGKTGGGNGNHGNGNVTPGSRPNSGNHGSGNHHGSGNGNGKPDGKPNGGNGNHGNGHGNGNHGYGNNNHYDYTGHHYHNDYHNYYTNHLWSWSRPLPPPARPYRPAPLVWYRPVIPAGWYPYAGAPVIDRVMGITFGTLFDASLDYLYYNGYEIDGYADHIIYLRDVSLLNYLWDDVMLSYDSYDRLVNAQFVYHTTYYDRHRYSRIYRNLCRVYGQPVAKGSDGISWYGGNSTGWVTLSMHNNLGHYYTTVSIGY